MDSPFNDPAEGILKGDASLTDNDRESLWDIFHNSKSHADLAQQLQPLAVPSDTKHRLFQAKQATAPKTDPIEKTVSAITRVAQIPTNVLDIAEKYPNSTKALVTAAQKSVESENQATAAEGEKKPAEAAEPHAELDVPPTPSGHALVQLPNNSLHHLPIENVSKARERFPNLKVLHVEK